LRGVARAARLAGMGAATTWGLGAYADMALRLEPVATRAVQLAGVTAADRVLDVACGTGNGALAAAGIGARAVGVDLEPSLLAVARRRTRPGLAVTWREGDATALPVADAAFDVVLSLFGVMYAPDHGAAASELARVAAPGARIVLAAWTPESFLPAMGEALAPFLPAPPAGAQPPARWGDEAELAALLGGAGLVVREARRETVSLAFAGRMEAVGFLVRTAGHVLAARERLEAEDRWAPLLAALGALVAARGAGGPAGVTLTLEYLLARAGRGPGD
jgi:SAM-dependent methyltransferase